MVVRGFLSLPLSSEASMTKSCVAYSNCYDDPVLHQLDWSGFVSGDRVRILLAPSTPRSQSSEINFFFALFARNTPNFDHGIGSRLLRGKNF